MAVEHDGAVVLILIEHDGIVAHNDKRIPVIDFSILLDALPMESQPAVYSVMIASDQVLVTVESLDDLYAVFFILPEGVAKNIDCILVCDTLVPVVNHIRSVSAKGRLSKRSTFLCPKCMSAI